MDEWALRAVECKASGANISMARQSKYWPSKLCALTRCTCHHLGPRINSGTRLWLCYQALTVQEPKAMIAVWALTEHNAPPSTRFKLCHGKAFMHQAKRASIFMNESWSLWKDKKLLNPLFCLVTMLLTVVLLWSSNKCQATPDL